MRPIHGLPVISIWEILGLIGLSNNHVSRGKTPVPQYQFPSRYLYAIGHWYFRGSQ